MGGLDEVVRDGVDGLLVDGRDEDGLARYLERLADGPGLVDAWRPASRPRAPFADHVDDLETGYPAGARADP